MTLLKEAQACLDRARIYSAQGDAVRFRAHLEAGLAAARGSNSPVEVRLLIEQARAETWNWNPDAAIETAVAALTLARTVETHVERAEQVVGLAHYLAGSRKSVKFLRTALADARARTDVEFVLETMLTLVGALHVFGHPKASVALSKEMQQLARANGKVVWEGAAAWNAARVRLLAFGEVAASVAELQALLPHRGLGMHRPQVLVDLTLGLIDLGRYGDAEAALQQAAEAADTPWAIGLVAWGHSELAWGRGYLGDAEQAAFEAVAVAQGPARIAAQSVHLWAQYELGRPVGLPADERVSFFPGVRLEADAFEALAAGRIAAAKSLLCEAAGTWDTFVARNRCRALWGAGETAQRQGDVAKARSLLRAAEQMATALPLQPMLVRLRRGRPSVRPRPLSQPSPPLTPRERQVLELIRSGATSQTMAEQLGVRRSTVETHVRSAMEKLGARNRLHAAALAGDSATAEEHATGMLLPEATRILQLIADGNTVRETARILNISPRTAARRLASARAALSARNKRCGDSTLSGGKSASRR